MLIAVSSLALFGTLCIDLATTPSYHLCPTQPSPSPPGYLSLPSCCLCTLSLLLDTPPPPPLSLFSVAASALYPLCWIPLSLFLSSLLLPLHFIASALQSFGLSCMPIACCLMYSRRFFFMWLLHNYTCAGKIWVSAFS